MSFLQFPQALVVPLVCLVKVYTNIEGMQMYRFYKMPRMLWNSFQHIPSTISFDVASTLSNSFLILILISPVSLRWHLASRRRLWVEDFSILTPWPFSSSSSSWNHWILIGSFPEKCTLKDALSPAFTITGSENLPKASASIVGGSEN